MEAHVEDYLEYHRDDRNQLTHLVGIPLIVLSLFGMLWRWEISPVLQLNGADLLMILAFLFYCFLDWRLAIPLVLVFWGFGRIGSVLSIQVNLGLFLLGWVFQGVGHALYERRAPAFTKNLVHLMIGPMWVFAKCTGFPLLKR